MNKNINFSLFFICTIVLCLLLDLSQFFLLATVFIPLLLCIYCSLLYFNLQVIPLVTVGLLQCLESFCFYNNLLLPFIYLIPITGLAFFIKKNLYPSFLYPLLFIVLCSIIDLYIVKKALFDIQGYTLIQMSVIILVEICFSLTIKYWGMLDNRV